MLEILFQSGWWEAPLAAEGVGLGVILWRFDVEVQVVVVEMKAELFALEDLLVEAEEVLAVVGERQWSLRSSLHP